MTYWADVTFDGGFPHAELLYCNTYGGVHIQEYMGEYNSS